MNSNVCAGLARHEAVNSVCAVIAREHCFGVVGLPVCVSFCMGVWTCQDSRADLDVCDCMIPEAFYNVKAVRSRKVETPRASRYPPQSSTRWLKARNVFLGMLTSDGATLTAANLGTENWKVLDAFCWPWSHSRPRLHTGCHRSTSCDALHINFIELRQTEWPTQVAFSLPKQCFVARLS